MKCESIVVKNKIGLHARPAALFVQTATRFLADIYIKKEGREVNAKSIMGVMALGVSQGDEIELIAKGEDEPEAINALIELLQSGLDEE